MSWFDKLKKVIDIKIDIKAPLVSVNITKNSHNKFDKNTGHYYDPEKKVLHLHLDKIPAEIKKELPFAVKEYIEEGNTLFEIDVSHLIEKLYKYNKDNPDKNILAFFKDIIPREDHEALNASLFLRTEFRKGNDISLLKEDIRKRFGDKGKNISNLCTAGYFEEFLMPIFNTSKTEFKRLYEVIASRSIMAIFVHAGMKPERIQDEITSKLSICKQYGIKFIHIHGIGKSNIEKIKKCIQEQKEYFDFFEKKIYEDEKEHIAVVELLFK